MRSIRGIASAEAFGVPTVGPYVPAGPSLIPAPFNDLTTITYDGAYIWAGVKDGYGANGSNHLISKVDRSLASPGVIATVNIQPYGDGGLGTGDVNVRQIRSDGTHVFACLLCSKDTVANEHSGFLLIIDKTTNAVVGHCRFTGSVVGNPYRPFNCRSVCSDGAGNLYVAQTPTNGGAPTYPTILHKFVIADVIAAYPTYGTPALSKTTTHPYLEGVAFGAGYAWGVHGPASTGLLTRFDPATLDETEFTSGAFRGHLVTCALGYIWVGGSNGYSSTAGPLLRFDPATFPSVPVAVTTPVPMDVSGGMTISTDGTYLWFGGYASNTELWRFSVSSGSVDLLSTVALGADRRPLDLAFDGTSMWMVSRQTSKLVRISTGVGSEGVDYTLADGGPPIPHIPIVSYVSPDNGPLAGGQLVYIYTDDTTGATGAAIGGVALTSFAIYDGHYVQGVTGTHAAGDCDVTVTNSVGTGTLTAGYHYNAPAAPAVYSIYPVLGTSLGGETVYIAVDDSTGATGAKVGGAPLTSFAIVNGTSVSGVTAAHANGAVNVTVTNAVGESSPLVGGYTYGTAPLLTAISPSVGDAAGGTTVVFTVDDSSVIQAVYIANVALSSLTVVDATHVSGVTAAHVAGTFNAKVLNLTGFESAPLLGAYEFGAVPTISFLYPETQGPTTGGQTTNIYGSGFTGATSVKFGGVEVPSFTVAFDGYMPVVTPVHLQGMVTVAVTGASGLTGTQPNAYEYLAPVTPAISSMSDHVDVLGANFGAAGTGLRYVTSVKVDGVSTTFTPPTSDTSILFVAPAHVRGLVDVEFTTDGLSTTAPLRYFIPYHINSQDLGLAQEGGHLWSSYHSNSNGRSFIQKVDGGLSPPEVIATVETTTPYADLLIAGGILTTRCIEADGDYIFVGTNAPNNLAGVFYSYVLILDKATAAIVGHCRFSAAAYDSVRVSAIAFDGAGNFFVSTTNGGTNETVHVRKFSTAAVVAAYPSYGTAVWTTAIPGVPGLNRPYGNSLAYTPQGVGKVWLGRYDGSLDSYAANTGAVVTVMLMHHNDTAFDYAATTITNVVYAFGTLWVWGYPPSTAPFNKQIQRFDPAAMGSGSYDTSYGPSGHVGSGNEIAAAVSSFDPPASLAGTRAFMPDGTYMWLAGAGNDTLYRISTSVGTEAAASTITPLYGVGFPVYVASTGKMWHLNTGYALRRVSTGLGSEAAEYSLLEMGPYGY